MSWCNCPKCGHHLFRYIPEICKKNNFAIEIKCSGCKGLVVVSETTGTGRMLTYKPRERV